MVDPASAALLAWGASMTIRQAGHFFFELKGCDHVNRATHGHKDETLIGYNRSPRAPFERLTSSPR